jgi:hypothetical protein
LSPLVLEYKAITDEVDESDYVRLIVIVVPVIVVPIVVIIGPDVFIVKAHEVHLLIMLPKKGVKNDHGKYGLNDIPNSESKANEHYLSNNSRYQVD